MQKAHDLAGSWALLSLRRYGEWPSRRHQDAVPGCHELRPDARFPFIVSPYTPDAIGVLAPAMPTVGPCSGRDDRPCVVHRHDRRERKTGPCFALTVMRCQTHLRGFTVYPPGHVPHGRTAVTQVGFDGHELIGTARDAQAFEGTLFDAALDAAQGKAWPRDCPGGTDRWWPKQCRHLEAAARLCGVHPDLDLAVRHALGAALRVETLVLVEGAQAIVASPGYRSRGQAVCAVLDRVAAGPSVLERVLCTGHLAGLWGPALLWDIEIGRLRRWSFRGAGTPPP